MTSDAGELLSLAAQIPLKPQVEVFPLSEVNRALELLKHGNINGAAVARAWN